jgi:hypothetical protein
MDSVRVSFSYSFGIVREKLPFFQEVVPIFLCLMPMFTKKRGSLVTVSITDPAIIICPDEAIAIPMKKKRKSKT